MKASTDDYLISLSETGGHIFITVPKERKGRRFSAIGYVLVTNVTFDGGWKDEYRSETGGYRIHEITIVPLKGIMRSRKSN